MKDLFYSLPEHVSPWAEPVWEDFSNATEEKKGDVQEHPFFKLLNSLSGENQEIIQMKNAMYNGRCGDEVFLKYYARQCAKVSSIRLPKDKTYRIEVIDVWEMTRETLLEEASGTTDLRLPGKEGIAVLATRIS